MSGTHKPQTRLLRWAYLVLGLVCVGLGYVGAVVPLMPSTVFFLVALWAFKRSSPQFEDWLLNRSFVGPTLRDWEEDRSMRPRTKLIAIAMVWITIGISISIVMHRGRALWLPWLLLAIALAITIFIATRKTKRELDS